MGTVGNYLTIPIDAIVTGTRQREDLGDIDTLKFSIDQYGQLIPVVVTQREDGRYDLVDGERRLAALKALGKETVEVRLYSELDTLLKTELEIELTLQRKQFTWQEEVKAESLLHKMKREKARTLPRGIAFGEWGQKDSAVEMHISEAKLSQDLILAEALEQHPELVEAKSRADAFKIIRKKREGGVVEDSDLTKKIRENFLYTPSVELGLTGVEPKSVQCMVVDTTGIDLETILPLMFNALALTGHCYMFFELQDYDTITNLFVAHKINYASKPLIWHIKGEDTYQTFFWCSPGQAHTPKDLPLHLSHRRDKQDLHILAKPYQLLYTLVEHSTQSRDFCLDPIAYDVSLVKVCLDSHRYVRAYCQNKVLQGQYLVAL